MLTEDPNYSRIIHHHVLETLQQRGIQDFYPIQWEAIQKGLTRRSLVVSIPTASGKTLIAEVCAFDLLYRNLEQTPKIRTKIIYLAPLKALASEKFHEFTKTWGPRGFKIGLSVSDPDIPDFDVFHNDIIILTNEKADSLLRMNPKLIQDIKLVICDEIHLVNDETRGITLEFLLTRLLTLNPQMQIIGLSATIINANELAQWLQADLIVSDWRPVILKEGYYYGNEIKFKDGTSRKILHVPDNDPIIALTLDMIKEGGQVLIFANSRKNAESVALKLAVPVMLALSLPDKQNLVEITNHLKSISDDEVENTQKLLKVVAGGVSFHHAGLDTKQLDYIVEAFNAKKIKVISATPTLAAGVNTPARRVIIHSVYRYSAEKGNQPIPVMEYKQMAGRAGRPRYDPYGEVVILSSRPEEIEELANRFLKGEPEEIRSNLADPDLLINHVLGLIFAKDASTPDQIQGFLKNSFYATQLLYQDFSRNFKKIQTTPNVLSSQTERVKKNTRRSTGRGKDPLQLSSADSGFVSANELLEDNTKSISISHQNDTNRITPKHLPSPSALTQEKCATKLTSMVKNSVEFLTKHKFIEHDQATILPTTTYTPTKLGKITAQMYLNVKDAIIFREDLNYAVALLKNQEIVLKDLSWLHVLTKATGFPKFYLNQRDYGTLSPYIEDHVENFIEEEVPSPRSREFPTFAQQVKLAWILDSWIAEHPESDIVESFNIGQGDLHRAVETAQRLMRCLYQINKAEQHQEFDPLLSELQTRILYGIRKELLQLIMFRGVGRVKARKLYSAGFKTLEDLEKATTEGLAQVPLIGKDLAQKIKDQIEMMHQSQTGDSKTSRRGKVLLKRTTRRISTEENDIQNENKAEISFETGTSDSRQEALVNKSETEESNSGKKATLDTFMKKKGNK